MNCYNLLKALGVKASFFMIGVHVDNDYDRKEVSEIRDSYPMFLCATIATRTPTTITTTPITMPRFGIKGF